MVSIQFNHASSTILREHLKRVSPLFKPELSSYINIEAYANKIYEKAKRIEAWEDNKMIGLLAYYLNINESYAFITNVSIECEYGGKGIASLMMDIMFEKVRDKVKIARLEVKPENTNAIRFYSRKGFEIENSSVDIINMVKFIAII